MKKLFYAEDHDDVREVVSCVLMNELSCEVVAFPNGNSLVSAIQDGARPDIIISDLYMPNGSGLDVLTFLSRSARSIPFVFYSASLPDAVVGWRDLVPHAHFVAKDDIQGLLKLIESISSDH